MKIPKAFSYKGKLWKVKYQKNLMETEDAEGMTDFNVRTIILDARLRGKKKKQVFLHELFHSVIFEAHINQNVRFSEGVEEVLCDAFADLLMTRFSLKWKKSK